MQNVLLIDNYDSFTFNLAQAFQILGAEVTVVRNDRLTLEEADQMAPSHLVISPGPGRPDSAGLSMSCIEHFMGKIPVLGVCLGHQSITQVCGGRVVHAPRLMHGKPSPVTHDGSPLFSDIPSPFQAARYHSLIAEQTSMPDCLMVSARTQEGEIMALRHRTFTTVGVQFHPESVLTPQGPTLLHNFLKLSSGEWR